MIVLYTQLLTFGYLLASGVVEEKASRVVEVLLSTIRPKDLLGGKIIGLGLLGFGQLVVLTGVGLLAATLSGALDVTGDVVAAAALAVGWFVLGYAFYAGLFACAGALVPRQEELQSTMTPLTMLILISFFVSFIVLDDPDGTLAHVTAYIPFSAPITMPPRIALGEAPAYEIVIALAVTAAVGARADPARGPDLQRGRPPDRLRDQGPRRLASRRASPRLERKLLGAREGRRQGPCRARGGGGRRWLGSATGGARLAAAGGGSSGPAAAGGGYRLGGRRSGSSASAGPVSGARLRRRRPEWRRGGRRGRLVRRLRQVLAARRPAAARRA